MGIRIKLFAVLKEIAERSKTILEVPKEISCGEIRHTARRIPASLATGEQAGLPAGRRAGGRHFWRLK